MDLYKTYGGGGVGGEVQKKYSRKGKLNEKKNQAWPKKDSYKEFYNEKNSCGS